MNYNLDMENIMATLEYVGDLRTEMTHVRSGKKVITDAPVDNLGKGEAFSPTDLVSAGLCACIVTIMGQVAQRENIDMTGMKGEIVKIMQSNPRRIAEIKIRLTRPGLSITPAQRQKLINAAKTCPVGLSLAPEVMQTVEFDF